MQNKPLISIIVLSYNSSKTILETLDSVLAQGYSEIELIISDDFSTDNTLNIVKSWIELNGKKLKKCFLRESSKNQGISLNAKQGIEASSGKWIKLFGADDIFFPNAISEFVKFAEENGSNIVFSRIEQFYDEGEIITSGEKFDYYQRAFSILRKKYSAKIQNDILRYSNNYCPAPSAMFSREVYDKVGGLDTSILMAEDFPFWCRLTSNGVQLEFLDKKLVHYRVGRKSVQEKPYFKVAKRLLKYKFYLNVPNFGIYNHISQKDNSNSLKNKILFIILKIISILYIIVFRNRARKIAKQYDVEFRNVKLF
ncbi:MAG: glycosyltransferase [Bacteroidetes bacterium]|nr:glycosyltransferase [Bacteroidota bacterium]